jgi:beta-glucosidase
MKDTDTLTVTCRVRNTGRCSGKEVVQLYIKPGKNEVRRPIRELRGFEKVELDSGGEKDVTFNLTKRAFSYYEPRIHDWHAESGEYTIEIGSSSQDIKLTKSIHLTATSEIPIIYTENTTLGDLSKTERGRKIASNLRTKTSRNIESDASGLGEASAKMMQEFMKKMPLSSLVNFGMITEETLFGMLSALNADK